MPILASISFEMIVPAARNDFAALLGGRAPAPWNLVDDSSIAPPEVLQMLSNLADSVRLSFEPAAWLIVEGDEIVGLLSLVRPVADGEICIGYGIAPTRQNRGITTAAVTELVQWARSDSRIDRVVAECSPENIGSLRVLERSGFTVTGTRVDAEDGDLLLWQAMVGRPDSL